jgi:hypothetical protein
MRAYGTADSFQVDRLEAHAAALEFLEKRVCHSGCSKRTGEI